MKNVLLIAIAILLFSCGEPKEYEMTFGDYVDKYKIIQKDAEKIYEEKTKELLSVEDTTGRLGKFREILQEKEDYIKEKSGLSEEDFDLLIAAQERLKDDRVRLRSMTVGEVIKMQKLVEGK